MTLLPGRGGAAAPGRAIAGAFAGAVLVGTLLLALPVSTASGQRASLEDALFTATSAVCVTGLATVDTGTYWSLTGQLVVLALIQVGGLGIMTAATVVALLLSRRLGVRARLVVRAETRALGRDDVRRVVRRVVAFSLACEAVVAALLALRLITGYGTPVGRAVYEGVFHAVSAFNNAGFALYSDNLVRFAADPWVCGVVAAAVVVGGLGFPVVFELVEGWRRPSTWSVTTRITVTTTAVLLVGGWAAVLLTERDNAATLGSAGLPGQLLAAFFHSAMARTAGFNSLDVGAMTPATLLVTDALMFIGGGSAGTAGGIKVTTAGVLAFAVWAEVRGHPDVAAGHRRLPAATVRQALTVVLLGVALVVGSTLALLELSDHSFEAVLFEAVSAFATVGLSTGITADLPPAAHLVLVALMFLGRTGPLTVASALALRQRTHHYRLPEERTIVG
ncbi:TrkH family potassium uptake protein [Quadrisphaera sp. KR29]|uniref:TrkH family potassium uptake protein n=1 Tax=Quadrisphaera sp. KR29 TaxID=3461391 RepID=UPI004043D800